MVLELSPGKTHAFVAVDQLVALASAVIHAEEAISKNGVPEDVEAFRTALTYADPLMQVLDRMALLPLKR